MQAEISSFFMYSLSAIRLVHYDPGQEYTAHHDYGFSDLGELQGARFATLLLYLNDDGLEGGETTFPRYVNAETFDKLKVTPEEGKAVLFYSQLPDGNLDDFSQHSAEKPRYVHRSCQSCTVCQKYSYLT